MCVCVLIVIAVCVCGLVKEKWISLAVRLQVRVLVKLVIQKVIIPVPADGIRILLSGQGKLFVELIDKCVHDTSPVHAFKSRRG